MPTNIGYYGWTVPEGTDAPAGPEQFTELAMDIATTVRAIDLRLVAVEDLVNTQDVAYTPTWVGLTVGNGTHATYYRKVGSCVLISVGLTGAATPTTAFVSAGATTLSIPFTAKRHAQGVCWWQPGAGGTYRIGNLSIQAGLTTVGVNAVRQTDLGLLSPAAVWGTAVWGASGSGLYGTILVPV